LLRILFSNVCQRRNLILPLEPLFRERRPPNAMGNEFGWMPTYVRMSRRTLRQAARRDGAALLETSSPLRRHPQRPSVFARAGVRQFRGGRLISVAHLLLEVRDRRLRIALLALGDRDGDRIADRETANGSPAVLVQHLKSAWQ
jgi:hypothetical protein